MTSKQPLAQLIKGAAPSMLDASVANEVIDVCAAFRDLIILPQGAGKLDIEGRSATLTILNAPAGGAGNGDTMSFRVNIGGVSTVVYITTATTTAP